MDWSSFAFFAVAIAVAKFGSLLRARAIASLKVMATGAVDAFGTAALAGGAAGSCCAGSARAQAKRPAIVSAPRRSQLRFFVMRNKRIGKIYHAKCCPRHRAYLHSADLRLTGA